MKSVIDKYLFFKFILIFELLWILTFFAFVLWIQLLTTGLGLFELRFLLTLMGFHSLVLASVIMILSNRKEEPEVLPWFCFFFPVITDLAAVLELHLHIGVDIVGILSTSPYQAMQALTIWAVVISGICFIYYGFLAVPRIKTLLTKGIMVEKMQNIVDTSDEDSTRQRLLFNTDSRIITHRIKNV
jgi:hypothetical protein